VTAELTDPTLGSSEPDRFWTLANASEACPLVMSPLCWTLWLRAFELGTRGSLHDFGILPRSEVYLPDDPNEFAAACFHGRLAMNVDKLRTVLGAVPGSSADDFERDLIGRARPDAPVVPDSLRRLPFIAVRTPWSMLRQGPRLRRLHDDQLAWWQANVLDPAGTPDPRALLRESDRRFQDSFRLHLYARANLLMAMQAQLTRLATAVGGADLVGRVIGGVGGISETDLATHLWELSRGRATREEFIRRHGFHGPSGGSPIARSWRENPEQIDRLAAAYADRPDEFEPRVRERAAVAARTEAARELLHGLPLRMRPVGRLLLAGIATQVRHLEVGKASFVMAIDGARSAVRRIGAELVEAGRADDRDDAFYLTYDELVGPLPGDFAELIAYRRACRLRHSVTTLPMTWTGMPTPTAETADPRTGSAGRQEVAGAVVTGAAAGGGVVEGTARVVTDPDTDPFAPDEVLVCRFTDPGWAPLFGLAAAVVIDVGGAASHGAVVARELGIPCVIGTGDGTRVLMSGQRVRVDGTSGVVTVIG
jgi:pyruvate,water dikinase